MKPFPAQHWLTPLIPSLIPFSPLGYFPSRLHRVPVAELEQLWGWQGLRDPFSAAINRGQRISWHISSAAKQGNCLYNPGFPCRSFKPGARGGLQKDKFPIPSEAQPGRSWRCQEGVSQPGDGAGNEEEFLAGTTSPVPGGAGASRRQWCLGKAPRSSQDATGGCHLGLSPGAVTRPHKPQTSRGSLHPAWHQPLGAQECCLSQAWKRKLSPPKVTLLEAQPSVPHSRAPCEVQDFRSFPVPSLQLL